MWILTSAQQIFLLILPSKGFLKDRTTQVMYIAKLKDCPKRVCKGFLKWYDGGEENGITSKRIFEVEVFFSSQNIDFPFYWKRLLELFLCSIS
jgi:hypothetical protein